MYKSDDIQLRLDIAAEQKLKKNEIQAYSNKVVKGNKKQNGGNQNGYVSEWDSLVAWSGRQQLDISGLEFLLVFIEYATGPVASKQRAIAHPLNTAS